MFAAQVEGEPISRIDFTGPSTRPSLDSQSSRPSSQPIIPGLTAEQVHRLMSLIETPKPGYEKLSGMNNWILDSGASYHMTGNLAQLSNVEHTRPIPIRLPNGGYSMTIKHGSVQFSPKLTLHDVLFVPNLDSSLISIAQLIEEVFYTVTFTKKLCEIQDHTTRSPIGLGEQRRGVYLLKEALYQKFELIK